MLQRRMRYTYDLAISTNTMDPLQSNHIRLLHLFHGSDSEPIHVALSPVSLTSSPAYEALSYTWGGPGSNDDRYCINIHSSLNPKSYITSTIPVTPNLHLALQHLRLPSDQRTLWVDAICIDQMNVEERSAQVRIMKEIYANASHVVIWLGPSTVFDEQAFKLLAHFSSAFERRGYFRFAMWDYGRDGFPPMDAEEWVGLLNLFQREWWLRVWIIQEAVMARKATVMCGHLTTDWDLLMWVTVCFVDCEIMGKCNVVDQAPGVVSGRVIRCLRNQNDIPLLTILRMTRPYQATDERDNIFALLGLTTDNTIADGNRSLINYSTQTNDLFISLAVKFLDRVGSMEYLSYAGLSSAKKDSPLPSWVADWSYHNDKRCTLGANRPFRFNAAGTTRPDMCISSDHSTLTICGYTIGRISHLGSFSRAAEKPTTQTMDQEAYMCHLRYQRQQEKRQVKDIDSIASLDFHIPTGQTKEEAIWRTLACDMTPRSHRLGPESTAAYTWYRKSMDRINDDGEFLEFSHGDPEAVQFYSDGARLFSYLSGANMYLVARKLCTLSSGYIGSVPKGSSEGDLVCIFKGGSVPFVLRKIEEGGNTKFYLVGECYVHGVMDGEAMECKDILVTHREFEVS